MPVINSKYKFSEKFSSPDYSKRGQNFSKSRYHSKIFKHHKQSKNLEMGILRQSPEYATKEGRDTSRVKHLLKK